MKISLIVATSNNGKMKEFEEILSSQCDLISMQQAGYTQDIPEPYDSFFENALTKAKTVFDALNTPTIAEDSGLCVDALDGRPGVFSARYSGGDDQQNIDKVLQELQDKEDRQARFVCCVVLYMGGDNYITVTKSTEGKILHQRTGNNGFGYDPIFFSDELGMSLGVADSKQKNSISHRGKALRAILEKLTTKK